MRGRGGAELTDGGGDGGEASLWPPAEGGGEAPAPRPPVVVWPDGWEVWVEAGGGDLVAFLDRGVFSPPAACCFCCCRHLARRFLNHTCEDKADNRVTVTNYEETHVKPPKKAQNKSSSPPKYQRTHEGTMNKQYPGNTRVRR